MTLSQSSCLLAALLGCLTLAAAEPVPQLVKDINLAAPTGREIREMYRVGDRVFFLCKNPVYGKELWTSDGTTEGTRMLADLGVVLIDADLSFKGQVNGLLLFSLGTHASPGLWRSDGTPEGTYRIADVEAGSGPTPMACSGSRLSARTTRCSGPCGAAMGLRREPSRSREAGPLPAPGSR